MRIAVLSHNLTRAGGRSVGVNLVGALAASDSRYEFLMLVPPGEDYRRAAATAPGEWQEVSFDHGADRLIWELATVRRTVREFQADWIVALGNKPVVVPGIRSAVLLHNPHLFYDSSVFRSGSPRKRAWVAARKWYLRRTLPSVDVVFAQTSVAAHRVRSTYGVNDISILPNAVSALIAERSGEIPAALLSETPFRFLALSRYYPHKNLDVLADMFEECGHELDGIVGFLTIDADQHPGGAKTARADIQNGPGRPTHQSRPAAPEGSGRGLQRDRRLGSSDASRVILRDISGVHVPGYADRYE